MKYDRTVSELKNFYRIFAPSVFRRHMYVMSRCFVVSLTICLNCMSFRRTQSLSFSSAFFFLFSENYAMCRGRRCPRRYIQAKMWLCCRRQLSRCERVCVCVCAIIWLRDRNTGKYFEIYLFHFICLPSNADNLQVYVPRNAFFCSGFWHVHRSLLKLTLIQFIIIYCSKNRKNIEDVSSTITIQWNEKRKNPYFQKPN